MITTDEKTLGSMIREHLEGANGSVDLDAIAEALAEEIDAEMARAVLVKGLRSRVAALVAADRPPATFSNNGNRSGRWDQVAQNLDKLDDWYFSFTDRAPKHLMDCSAQDLDEASEWYEKRAEGYAARAESYRKLATRIRKSKKSSPADLPREEVRRLLNA